MTVMAVAAGGGSAIVNLQAWTVDQYGFSNATSTYVYGGVIVVLLLSFLASPAILSCAGPASTLTAGFSLLCFGFAVLAFSAPHPALAIGGAVIVASSGFCYPALQTLLAASVPAAAQARVQTGLSSCVLVAAGVGAALHSLLFAFVPLVGGVASVAFLLAAVCIAVGVGVLRLWALPAFVPTAGEEGGVELGTKA